jgi:hypothetical protein
VRAWLVRHPRRTFHFTPQLLLAGNAVESFFATLTRRRLRRGTVDLQAAINRSSAISASTKHNRKPKAFNGQTVFSTKHNVDLRRPDGEHRRGELFSGFDR